jgi:hypothetical protein
MSYITLNEAKGYLFPRGDAPTQDSELGSINEWILEHLDAVDTIIDSHIGHSMPAAATATKYYDGTGSASLWIDPATSISAVHYLVDRAADDWEEVTSGSYVSWPYNKTPIECLKLNAASSTVYHWPTGDKVIRVVGSFGYTIPAGIKMAAKEVMRRMLMRSEQFRTLFYQDSLATPASPVGSLPVLWDDELTSLVRDYVTKKMPHG